MMIGQELSQQDKANRLCFVRTINRDMNDGTQDLQEVMRSDEATFHIMERSTPGPPDIWQKGVNRPADLIQERGQNQAKVQC